jgi:hypothetical protein
MARLNDIAVAALNKHNGNAEKALPEFVRAVQAAKLLDDLALAFLRTITAGRGSGHPSIEAQQTDAGPTPSKAPTVGSIKVSAHDVRQYRRRTSAEKEAAERAMMASAEAVFELQIEGRAIGNIAIGELTSLKHDLVDDATHKLMLGAEQVRNAVLAELIERHCTVQDQLVRVRDAVSAKTLAQLVQQAEQEAPRRISEAMRRAAEAMERAKEIAA